MTDAHALADIAEHIGIGDAHMVEVETAGGEAMEPEVAVDRRRRTGRRDGRGAMTRNIKIRRTVMQQ
ncbi:hypothetical protein AB0L75_35665 [Streptomyces sp. NPDC052101]|uniref:hypothetical protein n=1 Tax=Streptomyces sp. NPDC052101 TaxID=3155763 RepID=UPI003443750A